MARKGILPLSLRMILTIHYPLLVQQQPPPVSPPSDILLYPTPLPCIEPESLGNDQIKSKHNSLEAPANIQENKRREIILLHAIIKETVESEECDEHYVHVCKEERIEDKVEPKCECSALKQIFQRTGTGVEAAAFPKQRAVTNCCRQVHARTSTVRVAQSWGELPFFKLTSG